MVSQRTERSARAKKMGERLVNEKGGEVEGLKRFYKSLHDLYEERKTLKNEIWQRTALLKTNKKRSNGIRKVDRERL